MKVALPMSRPQRRTQSERREEAERRIMETAVRLVAVRGLDGLKLADIGVEAGYSRGLPAHHYGTRAKFEIALIEFIRDEFEFEMAKVDIPQGLAGLIQLVRTFCDPGKDVLCKSVAHIVFSDFPLGNGDELKVKVLADLRATVHKLLERSISDGIKLGEVRPDANPKRLTFLLSTSINALIKEWLADPTVNLVAVGEELVQVLVNGLAPRIATHSKVIRSVAQPQSLDLPRSISASGHS